VSLKTQRARVAGRVFDFAAGERVHVEDSCKYTVEGFAALAGWAGFDTVRTWTDEAHLFSVHWLTVR
jgi:L-histidine Nalpha-methyltransferase